MTVASYVLLALLFLCMACWFVQSWNWCLRVSCLIAGSIIPMAYYSFPWLFVLGIRSPAFWVLLIPWVVSVSAIAAAIRLVTGAASLALGGLALAIGLFLGYDVLGGHF
jgi:hypothetical protein